jgi:hypothetical protein
MRQTPPSVKKRYIITLVVLTTRFILPLTPAAFANAKTGGKHDNSVMAMPLNKTGGMANQTSKVYRIKKPT